MGTLHGLADPVTSGRIHGSITPTAPRPRSILPWEGWRFHARTSGILPGLGFWGHPPQGAQRRVHQARPEQHGVPGRARGDTTIPLHFPRGLGQPGQEQGRHPCVPRLAKKKSSAVAGDLWWLMQGVINSYSSTRRVKRGATHWVELGRGRRGDDRATPGHAGRGVPAAVTIIWGNNPRALPRGCGASAPRPRFGCSR